MVSVRLSERRNSPLTEKVIKFSVVDLNQLNFGYQEKTITHSCMKTCMSSRQGCTNPRKHNIRKTKSTVAPNICWFSVTSFTSPFSHLEVSGGSFFLIFFICWKSVHPSSRIISNVQYSSERNILETKHRHEKNHIQYVHYTLSYTD
jgi:hypothetical protein